MRKFLFIFLLILLLPSVASTDIAYIVKDPSYPNGDFVASINDLGYSYDIIDNQDIGSIDFSNYEMILVGDERFSNYEQIPIQDKKSLLVNTFYLDDWGIADYAGSTSSTGYLSGRIKEDNMITQGMLSPIKLYDERNADLYYLPYYFKRAHGIENIVSTDNYKENPVIGIIHSGGELYDGGYAGERIAFFGITESEYWSSKSVDLFKNTLRWVLIGEDADNDGYHYDVDCNDDNESLWQIIQGYIDEDGDGYGTGNLIDVCSGENLLEGYVEIDGDCDDSDPEINPSIQEIPYDGIDQDCSGQDLIDVDEDGFNSTEVGGSDCNDNNESLWQIIQGYIDEDGDGYGTGNLIDVCSGENLLDGYVEVDGDCNDSDDSINPGSEDVYKNCNNDAPIIQLIEKIIVNEGENAAIEVIAEDPEDDLLIYEINDSRFIQDSLDENIFRWQTDYGDWQQEPYIFLINVSDGSLDSEIEFQVEVENTNRAPICLEIPEQEWLEDTNHSLDLNMYCSDPDNEMIGYGINNTSNNTKITLESFEQGIANFSVEKNWNGQDWIIFKASDGKAETLTNKVNLSILPVNDALIFSGKIENITWNEDENLEDYLNLEDYFSDVDSELEYEFIGDYFIDIQENSGLVSFYPQQDWFGSENVVVNATDGEFSVLSNAFSLNVLDVGEPPEFGQMDCDDEIDEDIRYSCVLNASDFEGDEITFSIVDEDNLNCQINGEELEYQGNKDYNGQASCSIRAQDNDGYDDFTLEVDILPMNDAPEITDYEPKGVIKLFEYTEEEFSISAQDVDGDSLDYLWFLQGSQIGETNSDYLFNESKGNYDLLAFVTDGFLNDSYEWNVFVGDVGDFTCQEVGGDICSQDEICKGNLLGVYDTDSCCDIKCEEKPPEFRDIDTCERDEINLSENIVINIKEPDEGDEFEIGEDIDVEIEIENNLGQDEEFDYEVYFYDISDDEIIEDEDDSDDIDDGDSVDFETEFEVPLDIDDGNRFAIYVRVNDEDENFCNENYVEIDIERKENEVILESFGISPEGEILCGDYVDLSLRLKNQGKEDEDMYISAEIAKLGIYEESEEFELEKYGDGDSVKKNLYLKIPENATQGEYELEIILNYDDEKVIKKEIILGECKSLDKKEQEIREISLEGRSDKVKKDSGRSGFLFIITIVSSFVILGFMVYIFYLVLKG